MHSLINDSGITKKEQQQHPQTIVDIVGFYQENTVKGDEVSDNFDNSEVPDLRVGANTRHYEINNPYFEPAYKPQVFRKP